MFVKLTHYTVVLIAKLIDFGRLGTAKQPHKEFLTLTHIDPVV